MRQIGEIPLLRIRLAGAASFAALSVLSGPAFAETSAAEIQRAYSSADEIIVEGRYLSLDKLNAVKTPTPIIDVPQSLSIIGEEAIANQAYNDIGDILRYTAGLSISQGEGHRDAIIIRGVETTADFFIDGVRDDVQYFRPLYNIQQIEILRGANALLFGRGGGGGVINRVTKQPVIGEQFAALTSSVDTFGSFSFSGDANLPAGDSAAFRVNAFYEDLANHRDFFDGSRYAVNPTFAADIGADTMAFLSYEYVNDDRVVDRGVPSVSVAGGPDVPLEGFDNTFFGSPDGNVTTLEAHILRARVDHTFSDMLRGNITAQYGDYDKLYQNIYAEGFDATSMMLTLDGYQDTTTRKNFIIQANLVGEFETGPFAHTLLVGAEYGDQDTTNARNDNFFPSTNDDQATILFTDPLVIPAFAFSTLVRDRQSEVNFTSVYIQDQIDITDSLKVVVGGRYDRFDIDVLDIIEQNDGDAVDGDFDRLDEVLTPRFGLIYKPVENTSFYASYSETFLPRSGDQFLTLNLDSEGTRPQFFKNIEIGAKWDITPELALTTALFRLERESFTTVLPSDPSQLQIIDGAVTKGFELQLVGNLSERWFVNGGFSYLDGEVDGGGFDGNRTRQTPETMFSLWNLFQATDRLGVGVGVTHQGSMFVREDNAVELPAFTRVDAALFYTLSDNLRVQVNVENILDTDYFPDAHSNDNISTGAPLNAKFTIRGSL